MTRARLVADRTREQARIAKPLFDQHAKIEAAQRLLVELAGYYSDVAT
jgi:hypothetical protein